MPDLIHALKTFFHTLRQHIMRIGNHTDPCRSRFRIYRHIFFGLTHPTHLMHKLAPMGKQHNSTIKRKRRKNYIKRKREQFKLRSSKN
jgi:hypothetical protein